MGVGTDAMLAYGYDLGGDDDVWKVREVGEYGELLELPWFDPENEYGDDFKSAAEQRLLAEIAGFAEEYPRDQPQETQRAYFDRKGEAEARLGVEFDTYCSGEYPMWLLATKVITVHRGDCKTIDMTELVEAPNVHGWDEKLAAAVQALGLTPTQERPRWLLVSYRG